MKITESFWQYSGSTYFPMKSKWPLQKTRCCIVSDISSHMVAFLKEVRPTTLFKCNSVWSISLWCRSASGMLTENSKLHSISPATVPWSAHRPTFTECNRPIVRICYSDRILLIKLWTNLRQKQPRKCVKNRSASLISWTFSKKNRFTHILKGCRVRNENVQFGFR